MAYDGAMVSNGRRELFGDAYERLAANDCDPGALRPWKGRDGRNYICVNVDGKPKVMVTNAPATMSYDSWKVFDSVVEKAVVEETAAVADLRRAGLTYDLPNGMAHTFLQNQLQYDITPSTVSMDPARRSEVDRPVTDVALLPLPIIHKDFDYGGREILVSRSGNMALDTDSADSGTRKNVEEAEKMLVGTVDPFTYGLGTVYGYRTHPARATNFSLTAPTGSNGPTVVNEFLGLRQLLINDLHRGPYQVYVNMQWAQFLDNDFSTVKGDGTLRSRILAVQGFQSIQTLEFLPTTNYEVLVVEMRSRTVRLVVGVEPMMVQWESMGGFMRHFKSLLMWVPQIRADSAGNLGIAHGRSATP
jgi:hypothetical protein